ncbi:MAG: GNAT family N-acetyltransferase [Pseudomonadota bacterium]
MILKTKNFYLRPFQESDFDAWCEWVKSSEAIDYLSADFSEEKAKKILDKFIKSWQDFGFTKFAIFTHDSEELVGYAGFALLDDLEINKNIRKFAYKDDQEFSSDLELGYRLHKKFWGKGYASELAGALCTWAFKKFPINRIVAVTELLNIASQKVLLKNGFEYVGKVNSKKYGEELFYFIKES